jgi:DHA3 family macrolide efflux protein-like MFS transporter
MALTRRHGFAVLWLAQAISLVGAGLTAFTLGVYVYQTTGSISSFTLIQLLSLAPAALLSPFAGALTDRWDRRRVLIAADLLAALVPLLLAWCLRDGHAALWQIGLAGATISTLTAFQWPAFATLTALIVPSEHLGRATGATELARGLAQMISPITAGLALGGGASISTLLALDSASYLSSAAVTILIVRGRVAPVRATDGPGPATLAQDIARGWRYLVTQPELLLLWGFVTFTNLSCGIVEICITPRVLSMASPAALGGVALIAGLGMLLGGVLMSVWRGARRPTRLVLMVTLLQGALLVVAGASRGLVGLTAAACLYMFSVPIGMGTNQAIWLRTVPAPMQGSVLGLRRATEGGALPLAALIAGPLVEQVFDPLLARGGRIAGTLADLVEAGPGRGIALMYVALGVVTVLASLIALARHQASEPAVAEELS